MKTAYNLTETQDFESLVFEHKNQSYGAYQLRRGYAKTLNKALFFAIILVSAALILPTIYRELVPKETTQDFDTAHDLSNIPLPPPINEAKAQPPMPKIEQPQAKLKTVAFPPPSPTPDEELTPDMPEVPTIAQVSKAIIGSISTEGEEIGNPDLVINEGTNTENRQIVAIEDPETPMIAVEQMPDFQGGMLALTQYLSKNLRYPRQAQNQHIMGKVYVAFVVGKDGNIYDVKVLKGIGYGCDEEAIRVVSSMPRWIAGKQNGKPVAVRYNLPIVFKMQE
jgi:periplasmic protein TonB